MSAVLVTEKLVAGYGEASVLAGISLTIEEGRTLALLGVTAPEQM